MFKSANVGTIDRAIRLIVGALLVLSLFVPLPMLSGGGPVVQWGLPLIGLVLIATAVVRFCPLYRMIGASTCRTN